MENIAAISSGTTKDISGVGGPGRPAAVSERIGGFC